MLGRPGALRPARVRRRPEEAQVDRTLLQLAQDHRPTTQDTTPGTSKTELELHSRRRSLQPHPHGYLARLNTTPTQINNPTQPQKNVPNLLRFDPIPETQALFQYPLQPLRS